MCRSQFAFAVLAVLFSSAVSQDCGSLSDPLVFDPLFYLNDNPDLQEAGLTSIDDALTHWCENGINEGRQGCSMFHVRQYLDRYEDLHEAFGDDYASAIEHYVTIGFYDEGRIGYLEGGGYSRWTIRSNSKPGEYYVYVSASERTGGAIDSVVWKNKEFINNFDHGRQLQLALTLPPYGECWNPTEAGGRSDGTGDATKSIIQSIHASQNVIKTTNHPAYWFRANSSATVPGPSKCDTGDPAQNQIDTHPHDLSKNVTIGCFGMDNCIEWTMSAELGSGNGQPTDYDYAQLEGPTAYCMADFKGAKRWNYETDQLIEESETNEQIWPVIITTLDNEYAIGSYAHPNPDFYIELRYAYFDFGITVYSQETYKWSIVYRESKNPGDRMEHTSWVCIGSLDMVHDCLRTVRTSLLSSKK